MGSNWQGRRAGTPPWRGSLPGGGERSQCKSPKQKPAGVRSGGGCLCVRAARWQSTVQGEGSGQSEGGEPLGASTVNDVTVLCAKDLATVMGRGGRGERKGKGKGEGSLDNTGGRQGRSRLS